MKKVLFLYLISSFWFLVSSFSSPILALDPIIITETKHSYPSTSGDDQNYIPSDPKAIDTVSIEKTINFSQSFGPEIESQPQNAPPIYRYQNINQISKNFENNEINTSFYRQNFFHFGNPSSDPLDTDKNKSNFTNFSFSNSTRRSVSAATQKCLISNQVADIATFMSGGNSLCIDREIKPGLRVSQVISTLIANGLTRLYYPDPKCPPHQIPQDFPGNILNAINKSAGSGISLSFEAAQKYYLYGIEMICPNSLAQTIVHCDLDQNGQKSNCQETIRSQPLGAGLQKNIYVQYLPANAKIEEKDYSDTVDNAPAIDKPNPISWLARFFKNFYEGRLDEDKTFTGPHSVTTELDSRQVAGLESNETFFKNQIPASLQGPDDAASGTNGVTLDPGNNNSQLTRQFFDLTRPAAWQQVRQSSSTL